MLQEQNLERLKKRLVEVIGILDREKLFEMSTGHVSARVPDKDLILILGHVHHDGKILAEVSVDDLVLMDMQGKLIEGRTDPPGERFIHTAIYRKRKDVHAIVHNHPRLGVAFSIAGKEILPVGFRGSIFYPKVPICTYPGQIDTPEIGEIVANILDTGYSVLLQGHGAVTVGGTLEEMCAAAIALEVTAETQLLASLIGEVRTLDADQLDGKFVKGISAKEYFDIAWSYYSRKRSRNE